MMEEQRTQAIELLYEEILSLTERQAAEVLRRLAALQTESHSK